MRERIIGLEVEYNLAHLPAAGEPHLDGDAVSRKADELVWREMAPPDQKPFWPTGCKLYRDRGHLEWASQECRGPRQALAADKAGERLVSQVAAATELHVGGRILVAKNNLDPQGNTFGCHENYSVERRGTLTAGDEDELDEFWDYLVRRLVPFLVSRPVICGSGLWAPGGRPGFHLSQRAAHIETVVSINTIGARAIVNNRDEAHADRDRFRRLHLILGDANVAEIAGYLKLGTTSLVLEMIEALFLEEGPELADPVAALHAFSADRELHATADLAGGGAIDAIDLQRHYLDAAKLFFAGSTADDETWKTLALWEEVLAKLRQDPSQLVGKLDWVTKQAVLANAAASEHWDDLDPRLRELDLQYHGVRRDDNLLSHLERSGLLERLLEENEIESALHDPPPYTRARVRAAAAARGWAVSEWDEIRGAPSASGPAARTVSVGLDDPFDWCPVEALAALGLGPAEMAAWMATGMASDQPAVRIQALDALRQAIPQEAVGIALAALGDRDSRVRAAAASTLGAAAGPRSLRALEGALQDPHFLVRLRAREALSAQVVSA